MDEKPFWQSRTLWTQVVGLIAMIATASGVHVLDDPQMQAMAVAMLMALATAFFRVTSKPTVLK
jgi:hypothetical protein